jgi:hypothetical protein
MANYTSAPTGDDIGALLEEAGISKCGLDLEEYAIEALAAVETETGYKPLIAVPAEDPDDNPVYYFDPPGPNTKGTLRGGSRRMPLQRGFTAITEVTLYITPEDAVGTVQTLLTDYRLLPYNAITDNAPYTAIEFNFPVRGQARSVKVKGVAGYAETLPADLWNAIRKLGASMAATAIREGLSQDMIAWDEDDVKERMSIELLQKFGSGWRTESSRTIARYMLWDR